MLSLVDVRSWNPGLLDEIAAEMGRELHSMVDSGEDFAGILPVEGWTGPAADAALSRHQSLTSRLATLIAGASAVRKAYIQAADAIPALHRTLADLDELARRYDYQLTDTWQIADLLAGQPLPADLHPEDRAHAHQQLTDGATTALTTATEIDTTLAGVLHASTPAGGGSAAAGAGYPGIPGPPPDLPVDAGAGEHGSDPWYTRADDLIKRGLIEDIAMLADGWGWTHASRHLRHYLGNSGEDLAISPDQIMRDVPKIRTHIDGMVTTEMQRIATETHTSGTYGTPIPFSSEWQGRKINPGDHEDWFYAMASGQYAVTGVATVYPPEQPGGKPRIDMQYQAHVTDRYNWDEDKSTEILGMRVTDKELTDLHRAGVAQEFTLSGSSETKTFAGTVPSPGQAADLPAPPDNRDGTRTDPGR